MFGLQPRGMIIVYTSGRMVEIFMFHLMDVRLSCSVWIMGIPRKREMGILTSSSRL